MDPNDTGKIADNEHRVFVHGRGELATATALAFVSRGAAVAATETVEGCRHIEEGSECVERAAESLGGLTVMTNICQPNPGDGVEFVNHYAESLQSRCRDAADKLVEAAGSGAIINHCALPAMYIGTDLEDHMASLRGGIAGITRTYARKFGKQSLRVTAVQTGLVELADNDWLSDYVLQAPVPVKRWIQPVEVANFIVFLALDSTYTTGQAMIMDGGLTAGISGA